MANSLIGLQSVTFTLVVVQFIMICLVDRTALRLSMIRHRAELHGINDLGDLNDREPLLIDEQSQVLSV